VLIANLRKLAFVGVLVLSGCAALAPSNSAYFNPEQKLAEAREMIKQGRPFPAEVLLEQAIEGFSQRKDYVSLGLAHFEYAGMLQSAAYQEWPLNKTQYETGSFAQASKYHMLAAANAFELAMPSEDAAPVQVASYKTFMDPTNARLNMDMSTERPFWP
jgi:hypothetical protein